MKRDIVIESTLVPKPVTVTIYAPDGREADGPLPLMLLLHGGDGGAGFVQMMGPLLERAWKEKLLPPLFTATPHVGRSFYMDYRDGSAKWESFIVGPLLDHLRRELPVHTTREQTVVAGISMGGMGALRLGFKHPGLFAGIAALEPGIEAVRRYSDIGPRERSMRDEKLMRAIFGTPDIDEEFWAANHPVNIAAADPARLITSGLAIYLECGDEDGFQLHLGAELLHRVLWDTGIKHEYRSVRGADHIGRSLGPRFLDAFRFLGTVLNPPPPDLAVAAFRKMVDAMKAKAGFTE